MPSHQSINSTRVRINCNSGREYAAADTRWGTADPTVVALELLTVFGAAPLAALVVYQIVKGDPTRYYWIIVLSTAELYGGCVVLYSPSPRGGQANDVRRVGAFTGG